MESFEDSAKFVLRNTDSSIRDREHTFAARRLESDGDPPLLGVLEGVPDDVENDPFPEIAAEVNRPSVCRIVLALDDIFDLSSLDSVFEEDGEITSELTLSDQSNKSGQLRWADLQKQSIDLRFVPV